MTKILHQTETLIGETKSGKAKYWHKQIVEIDGKIYTRSVFWQEGSVIQTAEPTEVRKKNVGKSNETTELQQAYLEVESEVKRQLDKGYVLNGERTCSNSPSLYLPMLAHEYHKHSAKLPDRCAIQAKIDGVRCLSNGVQFWSRKGKLFIPEIVSRFSFEPLQNVLLDGELILPAPYSFQETVSAVKKYSELTDLLEYRVYDLVNPNLSFQERFNLLTSLCLKLNKNITIVTTHFVNQSLIPALHVKFVAEGYEGTMVRNPTAPYEINKRSYSLLKLKDFQTGEFEIVDVIDGKGKEVGQAIFTCKTSEGALFNCRPEGDENYRSKLFQNKENLIGKSLTIRYQNLTDGENKPRFPVGISIRDYE